MAMTVWRTLWCFYNSSAFETVANLALLGAIGVIIPALFTLPKERDTTAGDMQTKNINLGSARRLTFWIGLVTAFLSILPPYLYFHLLSEMGGETCEVKDEVASGAYLSLVALYASTALVILGFGWFYIKWQQTLRLDESLSE
jgi:hypothetical protein